MQIIWVNKCKQKKKRLCRFGLDPQKAQEWGILASLWGTVEQMYMDESACEWKNGQTNEWGNAGYGWGGWLH